MTYAVIHFLVPDPTDVLNHRGNRLRTSEEHQRLVNCVGTQVVCQAVRRNREVFPCALQRLTEAVKSVKTIFRTQPDRSAPDLGARTKDIPRFKLYERP